MPRTYRQSSSGLFVLQLHSALLQFPNVCFILALLTDITYWKTANLMWQNFSDWLLFAGLVVGGVALLVGIVELFMQRGEDRRPYWLHALGSLIVLALAFWNSLVHSADGWIAVVPSGLVLSAITVVVLLITDFYGRFIRSRQLGHQ